MVLLQVPGVLVESGSLFVRLVQKVAWTSLWAEILEALLKGELGSQHVNLVQKATWAVHPLVEVGCYQRTARTIANEGPSLAKEGLMGHHQPTIAYPLVEGAGLAEAQQIQALVRSQPRVEEEAAQPLLQGLVRSGLLPPMLGSLESTWAV